jgi:hypothetical protein
MEEARLFALYGSLENALAALEDLRAAGFETEGLNLLSPHAAGRHGSATVAGMPPDLPAARKVTIPDLGSLVVVGPLGEPLIERDIVYVLQDKGVGVRDAQTAAEGLRRGGSLLVVDAPPSSHDRVLEIVDRHHPVTLDSLGETYLEPGWSRADRVAGDEGVLEVASDRINVKRPGEDPSAFRPLAPGKEELGLSRSGAENPEAGKGEGTGEQGAGPDR